MTQTKLGIRLSERSMWRTLRLIIGKSNLHSPVKGQHALSFLI
jgi:hypothetical protein